jgi:uncharacterized protein (TIGR03437 family)
MRWNELRITIALAAGLVTVAAPAAAARFGTVVPIGGHASDIALDESRGALYVANFTANRIDVVSTTDYTIRRSINVAAQPGALALSPDAQFLVVAHYRNLTPPDPGQNLLTVIRLDSNARQTFVVGDPPLGVAFVATGQALVVTTTSLLLFDPVYGTTTLINTFANLSQTLPVQAATFPGQIVQTALASSGDGYTVWGVAGAGTGNQVIYRYEARRGTLSIMIDISSPPLLPRVSVSDDGSYAMIGWALFNTYSLQGRYPDVADSPNITGHAIDSKNGILYGQFPDASQPTAPPLASTQPAGQASSAILPAILLMDADNLTVRERIVIPENMVGRAVLSASGGVLYAISDSGVMVLPVGSLNQYHRVAAVQEDVLVQSSFCNRKALVQSLTIIDPAGGSTDFRITPSRSGVTVSPSSGTTPATVQVRVDPAAFQGANGTTPVTLTLSSATAINQPRPVRLLVNNPDQDQRGTVVNVPGQLTDILPDPGRNRIYILRQDKNQVLVFDAAANNLVATLRTATTPTLMSFTNDRRYLLVGHNDSQLVTVYDLDALQPDTPVVLPGGHYARSIADSNGALLVLARDESTGEGVVDKIDFVSRRAWKLPSLGVYTNKVSPTAVLAPAPNGRSILLAAPDGNVMLYSADADTFTLSRKDFTALSGAYAASAYDNFVIGDTIFNASLVPAAKLNVSVGSPSGFAFVDRGGYLAAGTAGGGPGVIENMANLEGGSVRPVRMSEAPLLPQAAASGTSASGTGSGSVSAYTMTSFTRTVAPLPSAGTVVVLTTSGFTVLAANYDAAVAPPSIEAVVNAADGTRPVAPGGLISVRGQQMSPVNMATSQVPLPTALGDSCLSVNGTPVPLLFVSSQQINAQLPFNVSGAATLSIHTPGGVSDNFYFTALPAAPGIFRSGTAGPETGLATVVRADNNQLVTPTNPIHPNDTVVIYLTGMGITTPPVEAGLPSPSDPLALAVIQPTVTLGGMPLSIGYAGLAPGSVGVYQINAIAPGGVPEGLSIPLVIDQGGSSTTLDVRVVK